MSDLAGKSRPEYRNIHITQLKDYRLPLPGWVSILHRVSGALLVLFGLPMLLYLFQLSVSTEISFERLNGLLGSGFVRLVLFVMLWALVHHICAGIRYLLLDVHVGTDKQAARASSMAVLGVSLVSTALIGLKLFGVI